MSTVIIGAGIIGLATAYYLTESNSSISPSEIFLIESSPELFASASGYAGGFLARDWFSPQTASLGALSFDLHKQLAAQHNGADKWGYSKTTTMSLSLSTAADEQAWTKETTNRAADAPVRELESLNGPAWLKRSHRLNEFDTMDDGSGTAQINPLQLCQFLLAECQRRGLTLLHPAKATSLETRTGEVPFSLDVSTSNGTQTLSCKRLILTAGAWTPRVFKQLFPASKIRIPVSSLAGHSVVLKSPHWNTGDEVEGKAGAHAIYLSGGSSAGIEIYARAGGELYAAGLNDSTLPLPDSPADRVIDKKTIARFRSICRPLLEGELVGEGGSGADAEADTGGTVRVVREGLCWRPVTKSGVPIVDRLDVLPESLPDGAGVWTAAGHGPWGISLSLGTGKVLSELVLGKETSADTSWLGL